MDTKKETIPSAEDIDWAMPDNVTNAMKEIKSGTPYVSFAWCDPKLGDCADQIPEVCELIAKNKKLKGLDFEASKLSNKACEQICAACKNNKINILILAKNEELTLPAAKAIDAMLKLNKNIKRVTLTETKLPPDAVQSIQSQVEVN